jgi:hypothetical protein
MTATRAVPAMPAFFQQDLMRQFEAVQTLLA